MEAMEYFYERTGVQPYLLICDSFDGKGREITDREAHHYLQRLYDSLYEDEGHVIFAFMEYEQSEYHTYLYAGRTAVFVLDDKGREMFLELADRFYTDRSLSDEAYFDRVFRTAADQIMKPGERGYVSFIWKERSAEPAGACSRMSEKGGLGRSGQGVA